jgi:hypothetical protein
MNQQFLRSSIAICGLLAIFAPSSFGQSIFEIDNQGSALLITDTQLVRANITDKTFSASTVYAFDNGTHFRRRGFSVSGKAQNGIGSIFNKDGSAQDATFGVFYGGRKPLSQSQVEKNEAIDLFFWTVKASYRTSIYKTIDQEDIKLTKRYFNAPDMTLYLQKQSDKKGFIIATSIGYAHSNNIDDLTDAVIQKQSNLGTSNGIQSTLISNTNVKKGTYKTFYSMPLVIDYLRFQGASAMATDYFIRTDLKGNNSSLTYGLALLFGEKGKPQRFHTGIALSHNKDDGLGAKLVGGLNF